MVLFNYKFIRPSVKELTKFCVERPAIDSFEALPVNTENLR